MAKVNHRRKDTWKIKVRIPISARPGKIIEPDSTYNRKKEKGKWNRFLKEFEQ